MNIWGAMQSRHAVRKYTNRKIVGEVLEELHKEVEACNLESGMNIQLITDEPKAFNSLMAKLAGFRGVSNYIALVGYKNAEIEELAGYFGQRLVLKAQMLGLNTCWVYSTYAKRKCPLTIGPGEKLICVIAVGYGSDYGAAHSGKKMNNLCKTDVKMPDWFHRGMLAAMLAPTAFNRQQFMIHLNRGHVHFEATGGPCSKINLGIVQYHFEQGVGKDTFLWID